MCFQLLSLIFLVSCDFVLAKQEESTLRQIHVIFRHGDRTPEKFAIYPADPYVNESYWSPNGFGSLTNKGKMQVYNIGKALRKRYNDFLGNLYYPESLYARSTDYDRTKMSLQLVLAGLWPPTPVQLWNILLPWQPIPYEYEPMQKDKLMKFPLVYCKKYQEEYAKAQNSEEIKTFLKENVQTINHINKYSGLKCKTTLDLLILYFVLYTEEGYNLKLPEWTTKIYPDFLKKATQLEYQSQTFTDEMIKNGGGHLIKKIIQDSNANMDNNTLISKKKKIFLYSGHEYNIVHILSSLKLFDGKVPNYASYVIIELHKINNQYGFKVYYQDYSYINPKLLTIPRCEQFCNYDKFYNLVFNILPENDTC